MVVLESRLKAWMQHALIIGARPGTLLQHAAAEGILILYGLHQVNQVLDDHVASRSIQSPWRHCDVGGRTIPIDGHVLGRDHRNLVRADIGDQPWVHGDKERPKIVRAFVFLLAHPRGSAEWKFELLL